jgi:hypothetical protein
MPNVLRATVRLDENDARFVAALKSNAPEAEAFTDLTGTDARTVPAGTIVNALVEAGMQAVRERAEQLRYARLAEHIKHDPEHKAWHASRRTRNARRSTGLGDV